MRRRGQFGAALLALVISLLLAGTAQAAAPAPAGMTVDPDTAVRLQGVLAKWRTRYHLQGLSAAVLLADGSHWEGVTGLGKVDPGSWSVQPSTPFDIGSITKTFVAALVLRLAERGVLSLDQRLSRWMPGWPRAHRITLRELLQHRAGQMDYFTSPSYDGLVFGRPHHRWTVPEILDLVGSPIALPGSEYHYANTDYVLLGRVIERATGRPLGRLIHEELLDPLMLRHIWFQGEEPLPDDGAYGYLRGNHRWIGWSDGSPFRPNRSAATVAWAAGAMMATPSDLVHWAQALYGGSVLQPASLKQMLTFVSHDVDRNVDYGLGAERRYQDDRLEWGHGGSLRGFEAGMWYVPDHGLSVAVASNRGRVKVKVVTRDLIRVLYQTYWPSQPAAMVDGARAA